MEINIKDLMIKLIQDGIVTKDNCQEYGLNVYALVEDPSEQKLIRECLQKGIITNEDLSYIKACFPITYFYINFGLDLDPDLDDFLSNCIREKINNNMNIDAILPDLINRLGVHHSDPDFVSKYSKTIELIKHLYVNYKYTVKNKEKYGLYRIIPFKTTYSKKEAIQTIVSLLNLNILTYKNFKINDFLLKLSYGDTIGSDMDTWRCNYSGKADTIPLIKLLASKGIMPGLDYKYTSNDRYCQIDHRIYDYCEKIKNTFNNLQGLCIIALLRDNKEKCFDELLQIPEGFYSKFITDLT
jgi:hypothetical protein